MRRAAGSAVVPGILVAQQWISRRVGWHRKIRVSAASIPFAYNELPREWSRTFPGSLEKFEKRKGNSAGGSIAFPLFLVPAFVSIYRNSLVPHNPDARKANYSISTRALSYLGVCVKAHSIGMMVYERPPLNPYERQHRSFCVRKRYDQECVGPAAPRITIPTWVKLLANRYNRTKRMNSLKKDVPLVRKSDSLPEDWSSWNGPPEGSSRFSCVATNEFAFQRDASQLRTQKKISAGDLDLCGMCDAPVSSAERQRNGREGPFAWMINDHRLRFVSKESSVFRHIRRLKHKRLLRETRNEMIIIGASKIQRLCRRFTDNEGRCTTPDMGVSVVPDNDVATGGLVRSLLTDCPAVAAKPCEFGISVDEAYVTTRELMRFVVGERTPQILRPKMSYSRSCYSERTEIHHRPSEDGERGRFACMPASPTFSFSASRSMVVGVLTRPVPSQSFSAPKLILAIDRVKYTSNLGILLRAAAALRVDGLYFVEGSADPFNWKVLDVSDGLHIGVPYQSGCAEKLLQMCKHYSLLPVVADVGGSSVTEVADVQASFSGLCCILSNESAGPSDAILKHCTRVSVPMSDLVDSLNVAVAGGIILSELKHLAAREAIS